MASVVEAEEWTSPEGFSGQLRNLVCVLINFLMCSFWIFIPEKRACSRICHSPQAKIYFSFHCNVEVPLGWVYLLWLVRLSHSLINKRGCLLIEVWVSVHIFGCLSIWLPFPLLLLDWYSFLAKQMNLCLDPCHGLVWKSTCSCSSQKAEVQHFCRNDSFSHRFLKH